MPFDGTTRYEIGLYATDRTAAAFQSVDRRVGVLEQVQKSATSGISAGYGAVTRALAPLAAALSAAALAHRAWTAGMQAANLGEEAEQIGLTVDQLQAYRFAGAQVGVTNEQLDASVMRLTKSMGEANAGSDDAIARFDRLGVKLLDVDGNLRKPAEVLPELARGLLSVRSETERNALMMDFFGRSGGRMVTMLETWARGSDAVVESARSLGGVMGPDTVNRWDKLGDALARATAGTSTLLATLTAPAAGAAADLMERLATNTQRAAGALAALPKDASFMAKLDAIFGGRRADGLPGLRLSTPAEEAADRLEADRARLEKLVAQRPNATGRSAATLEDQIRKQTELVQKQEAAFRAAAKEQENAAARERLLNDGLPASNNGTGGARNPRGSGAAKTAATEAAQAVRETQRQIDELVATVMRQQQDAAAVMDRYGDGTAYAAREIERLAELQHLLDPDAQARALEEVARQADDMGRAYRGAAGGAEAFIAGFEQALVDMERSTSLFELGRRSVDYLSQGLDVLAGTSSRTFGQMAADFGMMLAKWEVAAQGSNIYNMVRGKGPTDQGIFGALLGGLGSLFGGSGSNVPGIGTGTGQTYHDGGIVGHGGGPGRSLPMSAWANAPRFHGGGIVGADEVPIIARRGERVLTQEQQRGLGAATVVINIHDNGNNQIRAEQSTGAGGQQITDIFIDALDGAMAQRMNRGASKTAKVMEGRYGLTPVGRR